jgi:PKD repeat protein
MLEYINNIKNKIMNKSIKILSILFILTSFIACDIADEEIVTPGELVAKYTFVREASPGKITFINTSQNADSFVWDFGDGTTSTVKNPVKTFSTTGDYNVKLTARRAKTGETRTFTSVISLVIFQGGLITNGDFENGTSPWTLGTVNPLPIGLLTTENGNTYFSINVGAAGNPFDVNLSHKGISMTQGVTYRLTFDAWSNVNRSMVVGIGLSGDPWTNQTVPRNLTTTVQSFSIDLVANFSNPNARVIFDMGAAVGRVNIDNVTLNAL